MMKAKENTMSQDEGKPVSPQSCPDTARSYERAKPSKESGMGRLHSPATPESDSPDREEQAVKNQNEPRQLNAHDVIDQQAEESPTEPRPHATREGPHADQAQADDQPDHSMHDEEPLGWDQAPQNIQDPRQKRHPRTKGTGGLKEGE
jgi:hypothetical protein